MTITTIVVDAATAVGAILLGRAGRWLSAWRLDRRLDDLRAESPESRLLEALRPYPRHRQEAS